MSVTYRTDLSAEEFAALAKAFAHPARVRIVELLARQTECRGHDVFTELPLAQSTVSEHLRILRQAGVVSSSPVGPAATYCLNLATLDRFAVAVGGLAGCAAGCTPGGRC